MYPEMHTEHSMPLSPTLAAASAATGAEAGANNLYCVDAPHLAVGNPPDLADLVNAQVARVQCRGGDGDTGGRRRRSAFACKVCGKYYRGKSNLLFHVERSHMLLRLPCPVGCGALLTSRENVGKHARKCDGVPKSSKRNGGRAGGGVGVRPVLLKKQDI